MFYSILSTLSGRVELDRNVFFCIKYEKLFQKTSTTPGNCSDNESFRIFPSHPRDFQKYWIVEALGGCCGCFVLREDDRTKQLFGSSRFYQRLRIYFSGFSLDNPVCRFFTRFSRPDFRIIQQRRNMKHCVVFHVFLP